MKKNLIITVLVLVLGIIIITWTSGFFLEIYTYKETAQFANANVDLINVDIGDVVANEIIMPYDEIEIITIDIENSIEGSVSNWKVRLLKDSEELTNSIVDAQNEITLFYKDGLQVDMHSNYKIEIELLENSNEDNRISITTSQEANNFSANSNLRINQETMTSYLAINITGGIYENWWYTIYVCITLFILILILKIIISCNRKIKFYNSKSIMFMLIMLIVFFLYFPYANLEAVGVFTDEIDNIRGGMIIAEGGELYKDYVTQHNPFMYYLCSIFAKIGATSISQMRILYYIFIALIWGIIYLRNEKVFGKKVMIFMPIFVTLGTRIIENYPELSIIGTYETRILYDSVASLFLIVLFLEFWGYLRDKKIDWKRAIIISISLWGAFLNAFMVLYCILFIVIAVIVHEMKHVKEKKVKCRKIFLRYLKLVIACIIPLIIATVYVMYNDIGYLFYEQAYVFNREVYPQYYKLGENLIQPIIMGIISVVNDFSNNVQLIGKEAFEIGNLMRILFYGTYIMISINLIANKKIKIFDYIIITVFATTACSRGGESFHSMMFWYLILSIILVLVSQNYRLRENKKIQYYIIIMLIILIAPVLEKYSLMFNIEPQTVTYEENYIVSNVGENRNVFYDAMSLDSIYILGKDVNITNRAVYILPWYMKWFEQSNIEALDGNQVELVVYNETQDVWGYTNFSPSLTQYINNNYEKVEDSNILWTRK